ncbi:cytochrome c mitochondrial import factor CYC2 [Coccidioides immitis H538.4]|uniref:Cytochrome c mitochondrial import factor CYC2 n=1 Tax=Coccidioides immitis H538.4 TaxID=396776 RepID=A0A0J8RXF5_COCIT|nr:cytochrome c mitochondrial import factor CYC2 [Coccidioides immitis H538.4]
MVAKFPAVWGLESTIRALAWKTCRNPRSVQFRENATSSNTSNSLPKRRRWLQITILTVAAGGIGAYLQYREKNPSSTLNPFTFTKYQLISKAPISSTCSVFTLRPVKQAQNYEVYLEAWRKGLWSVQFKQPHLQVGRDYTPLPPIGEDELPIDEAVRNGFTVSQLEELKLQSRGRLSVDYFVDEENTLIGKETILHFTGQMDKYETDNRRKTKLILISGPDGFISYLAGPKLWRNGVEIQGPLQGLLEQLNLKGWTVWKL